MKTNLDLTNNNNDMRMTLTSFVLFLHPQIDNLLALAFCCCCYEQ